MVVPTGLFPVKTGIYMPNNFKGLDRRPIGLEVKTGEIFAMKFSKERSKFCHTKILKKDEPTNGNISGGDGQMKD
jgi:hypothetical protein